MPQARSRPSNKNGRPLELPGAIGQLARAAGGITQLAQLLGVSVRSLQRWAKTPPRQRTRMLLERVAADLRLPQSVQRQIAN